MDAIPVDLLASGGDGEMLRHIEECRRCRRILAEELYSARRYLDGLGNPANVDRFKELMKDLRVSDPGNEAGFVEVVLHYDAGEPDGIETPLAAASRPPMRRPMRFVSDDGKMVIRELPEEGRSGYLLIADEAGVAGGAEVIVGEHSFRTAEDGSFGLGGSGPGVTRDTLFRVRYRRR